MRTTHAPKTRLLRLSNALLLVSFIGARAQDIRTSTFSMPTVPSAAIADTQIHPSQPPIILPSLPSALAIAQAHVQPSQPVASNTFIAPPPAYPSWEVIPSGVPRTASGRPIPCSPKNTKLNPTTHKLISECVETTFCSAPPGAPVNATGLGICLPRLCRRDEYPFGYGTYGGGSGGKKVKVTGSTGQAANDTTIKLPPMCSNGLFCPDNGSGCRLMAKLGEKCELARDEQCEAPPQEGAKSVCLHMTCIAATATLDAPCIIENTTYVSDINRGAAGGGQFTTFVIKNNCRSPGLFCDPTPSNVDAVGPTCQQTKKLGQNCRFDAECELNNCHSSSKKCAPPPETPIHITPGHWAATILLIMISMLVAFIILLFLHRRRQFASYQEGVAYYHEQMSLRRSILALHAAAAEQQSLTRAVHDEKK